MPRRRLILLSLIMCTLCIPAALAVAQGEGPATGPETSSFASTFFMSRKIDGKSIELFGSLIIWVLLALSLVSIGLIGLMALTNQRKSICPDGVVSEVSDMLKQSKFKEAMTLTRSDQSFFSLVLHAGLSEAGNGFSAMVRGLELASDEHTTIRLRRIEYLNVLGQVSPMLGLFGTVYGMILAFFAIRATGGTPDPVALAGGIGTALVTTFWGLIVAIPALAGYAVIRNRIDALTTEAMHTAEHLVNQFRPRSNTRPAQQYRAAPEPKPEG